MRKFCGQVVHGTGLNGLDIGDDPDPGLTRKIFNTHTHTYTYEVHHFHAAIGIKTSSSAASLKKKERKKDDQGGVAYR